MSKYIKAFREMTKADFEEAGGKAANLGELTQKGFPVPAGFCVTGDSLLFHIQESDLKPRINAVIKNFDYNDYKSMEEKTAQIRDCILQADIPQEVLQEIRLSVEELNDPEPPFVAVRSSVAVKGTGISSFPGMMDTYHYLKGTVEIIENIKKCWASLWTRRATLLRHRRKIDHWNGVIAPVVQKMVNSDLAGVMFMANPINGSRDDIVIEANWGLGETVVSGKYRNDFYLVDKFSLKSKDKRITTKDKVIGFDHEKGHGRCEIELPPEKRDAATLMDEQIRELGAVGLKINEAFGGVPQDIEWAYENNELYILQSRMIKNLPAAN